MESDNELYSSSDYDEDYTDSDDFDEDGFPFDVKLDRFHRLQTIWMYRYDKVMKQLQTIPLFSL